MSFLDFMLPASNPQDPNAILDPNQVARRQALADMMTKQGTDYSPVQSPWQGAARLSDALMGALGTRSDDKMTQAGRAHNAAMLAQLIGGNGQPQPGMPAQAPQAANGAPPNLMEGVMGAAPPNASGAALGAMLAGGPPQSPQPQIMPAGAPPQAQPIPAPNAAPPYPGGDGITSADKGGVFAPAPQNAVAQAQPAPQSPAAAPVAPQAVQAMAQLDPQALLKYMNDPYTSPQMQQVAGQLLQHQMAQNDPANQLALKKAQIEEHNLEHPEDVKMTPFQQAQADAYSQRGIPKGYQQDDQGNLSFIPGGPADPTVIAANSGAKSNGNGDADTIAQAIMNGDQPPDLKGLYGKGPGVRAAMEKKGYNFTQASQDWDATKQLLHTMNGAQQTRLRQAVGQVSESLPKVEQLATDLAAEIGSSHYPDLNKANLALAKSGLYGDKATSLANQLSAEIGDVTSELGTVYKGGNSSTDESLKLAAAQLNDAAPIAVMKDMIGLAKTNVQYRKNSLRLETGGIDNSKYNPMTKDNPPSVPSSAAASAPAGDPLAQARDAIAKGADPNLVKQRLQQSGIDASGL